MAVQKSGLVALRSVAGGIRDTISVAERSTRSVENRRVLDQIASIQDCLAGHLAEVEALADAEYGVSVTRLPAQQKS